MSEGDYAGVRARIADRSARLLGELSGYLESGGKLAVVKAPPGSGKTHLLLEIVSRQLDRGARIAIAAQTNAQADDVASRLAARLGGRGPVVRFLAAGAEPTLLPEGVVTVRDRKELPKGPAGVVATSAKWGATDLEEPFDMLCVDEAWQMSWATFMPMGGVAGRFLLIGDPGQIPPVVSVDTSAWETVRRPPHRAAPELVARDPALGARVWELPASRRLPHDGAGLVRPLYDFDFESFAGPGERSLRFERRAETPLDRAMDRLESGGVLVLTLPTPLGGPPYEEDAELAALAALVASRLLARGATVGLDDLGLTRRALGAEEIGLAATHRVTNRRIQAALGGSLGGRALVDTPERWQGLERMLMIAVHPLSGVARPSGFDLETGRLCVLASRHKIALVLLARDHVGETLRRAIPSADQALGLPDAAGRGHALHLELWERLEREGRIASLAGV